MSLAIVPKPKSALAQSSSSGIAIFVNGNGDCCTGGMDKVRQALRQQGFTIVTTPWDRFAPGAGERDALSAGGFTLGSLSNDRDFVKQLPTFVNSIPENIPVVLIGHSFGGDSLLSAVPRINRRILFLGVLDPVAAGGLRAPIRSRSVPGTVDYFFNRWQTTNVWPIENRTPGANTDGSVRCSVQQCDQEEQSVKRNTDGSEIRTTCSITDVTCPGFSPGSVFPPRPPRPGTAARRLQHEDVPRDTFIQRQIVDRLTSLIANFTPPNSTPSSPHPNYSGLNPRAIGCYSIRSLNNNFRNSNFRWLDAKSGGTGVGLVSGQSHGTVWLLEETDQGYLLRSTNQNHRSSSSYRWLDGMSNGTGVQLVSDTSHGAFWQLEQVRDGQRIRSLNNNFRNNNFRWLDGASNGSIAQLVNGTSHGTLWELTSTGCP